MNQAGSQEMAEIGIVQEPADILHEPTSPYDLPREADVAHADFERLRQVADSVLIVHESRKGLGVAAPQIGVGRRIAILRPWRGDEICLLNAVIVESSNEADERYEGCLSLFDARGEVPRSLSVTVEAQRFDGSVWQQTFTNGVARLIAHELDHLDGRLYVERMEGKPTISVDEYRALDGTDWVYDETDTPS